MSLFILFIWFWKLGRGEKLMSLFITNPERGKKEGDSDALFWDDLLSEPMEPFTQEELDKWNMKMKIKMLITHPKLYVDSQIRPAIQGGDLTAEVVWTYLVARKYEKDHETLAGLLRGEHMMMPSISRIWIEAYLQPTRHKERDSWKARADLAMGDLEEVKGRKHQIQSSGKYWVCIVESKWYDDIQANAVNNESNQLLKIIEHALLLHDSKGKFPDSVYVTLVTPKYFKEGLGKFSRRDYRTIYDEYNQPEKLKKALTLCSLPFSKHDLETLISRANALKLNWVTFEELLGLPNLVEDHVPGMHRVTIGSWKEVFFKIGREDLYGELSARTGDV